MTALGSGPFGSTTSKAQVQAIRRPVARRFKRPESGAHRPMASSRSQQICEEPAARAHAPPRKRSDGHGLLEAIKRRRASINRAPAAPDIAGLQCPRKKHRLGAAFGSSAVSRSVSAVGCRGLRHRPELLALDLGIALTGSIFESGADQHRDVAATVGN